MSLLTALSGSVEFGPGLGGGTCDGSLQGQLHLLPRRLEQLYVPAGRCLLVWKRVESRNPLARDIEDNIVELSAQNNIICWNS